MNERIKELRKRAWDYVVSCDEHLSKSATALFEEKFAELIIRECLKQTELARCSFNSQPQYTDKQNALVDEGFTWGADSCKDKIKQHFGVEE